MKKYLAFLIISFSFTAFGQIDNQQLGRGFDQNRYYGNYFDYSDPTSLNIKVSVWGYVNSPGKYLIPVYSTINDLMSYAGGPGGTANLDELRLYRINENGTEELIMFNYEDLVEADQLSGKKGRITNLLAGDILIVPGSPKYYFTDYLNISLSIFSAIVSLTILIINISN